MTPALLLLLPAAGLGVAMAGKAAPINCGWPSERLSLTLRRVRALALAAPSRRRRFAMGAALAGVIAAGGLAAYAAEPSAPDGLPGEVAGVVGSGDQLSLRLNEADGPHTLNIGQDYRDGWRLQALTPDVATLAKDGQVRRVGLNPTGVAPAASAAAAAPSQVNVLPSADMAQVAADVRTGIAKARADLAAAGTPGARIDPTIIRLAVGKGRYDAYTAQRSPQQALADARALNDLQAVTALSGGVVDGPDVIHVEGGAKANATANAGLTSLAGYSRGPDQPDGSFNLYRNGPGGASTVPQP